MILFWNHTGSRGPLAAVAAALLPALILNATLEWDSREKIVDSGLGSTEIATSFAFTNAGQEALVILDIKHSCGCTTTALDKQVYEPGEQGRIEVRMSLQGLVGEQVKTVSVYTSAAPDSPDLLYLYTDVPVRHELHPAILAWTMRAKPAPRHASIRFHPDLAFAAADIEVVVEDREATGLVFSVSLEPGKAPNELQVKAVPHDLRRPGHAYLVAYWRRGDAREKIGEAYLVVH